VSRSCGASAVSEGDPVMKVDAMPREKVPHHGPPRIVGMRGMVEGTCTASMGMGGASSDGGHHDTEERGHDIVALRGRRVVGVASRGGATVGVGEIRFRCPSRLDPGVVPPAQTHAAPSCAAKPSTAPSPPAPRSGLLALGAHRATVCRGSGRRPAGGLPT
jgi:hypothetical protein